VKYRKTKKNKDRFYVHTCPACGYKIEGVMDLRKKESIPEHYWWCWDCDMQMERVL